MSTPLPVAASSSVPQVSASGQQPRPSLGIIKRRENSSNPLVSKQRRPRPPPGGLRAPSSTAGPRHSATPPALATPRPTAVKAEPASEPDWQEFKLTTTKREILAGYRHHVMRLQSKRIINPMNPDEFTMPIRLHRRDPKAPLQGGKEQEAAAQAAAEKGNDGDADPNAVEERAKKDAEKAAQAEKIAPYGGAQKQKKLAFKKKTQQVFKQNEADKKLRYEEYFPWFIEDFDNKNTWQGQLENPLSGGTFAMFVLDEGAFKMVPIEKWYKFTEKNKFKTLSIEEAESAIKKATRAPRWLMKMTKAEEKEQERIEKEKNNSAFNRLATRRGDRLEKLLPKSETADADDLDFDDDRFADDEEAPVMEGEEQENKEIEVHPARYNCLCYKC
jgi:transcription initiation factor TFIIF subunit alpha